jgi:hypothetical protein
VAFTELEIWNLALTRIGQDDIRERDDKGKGARLCRQHYQPVRDALLRRHAWNFATARLKLGLVRNENGEKRNKGFKLPADCIRVVRGFDPVTGLDVDFRVEGREVKTAADTIKIEYIAKVSKEGLFDPLFVEALAWSLASALAMAFAADPKIVEATRNAAQQATLDAIWADLGEGVPRWLADAQDRLVEKALIKIGADKLETIEEGWRAVSLANRALSGVIKLVLRQHSWNFRTLRTKLTSTADKFGGADDWTMQVAAPGGLVRLVEVRDEAGCTIPYVFANGVIRSNHAKVVVEYIGADNDTREPLFDDAVTWKLAADMISFGDGRLRAADCLIAYERALSEARLADAQENPATQHSGPSSWELARL